MPTDAFEGEDYADLTCEFLMEKMKRDPMVTTIVAAVPKNIGFTEEKRREAGGQFVDVGIAEEHGIAFCSGIAKNGGKPVFATHSSFMQRTYDQLSQDLCVNRNPATILVNTASIYGMNDITHLGIYDIAMMSNIPNLVYLAPTNSEEYFAMLDWKDIVDTDYSVLNRYQVVQKGSGTAVVALGDFFQLGEEVAAAIGAKTGVTPTLINPRYITGLDEKLLKQLTEDHAFVVTLEDGILDGGFGEKIARFYGPSNMKVFNYGLKKEFLDRYAVEDVMKENHLSPELILQDLGF